MKFDYKKTIIGFELTKEEAKILRSAEKILVKADEELCEAGEIEIDGELLELVRSTALALGRCNVKFNSCSPYKEGE